MSQILENATREDVLVCAVMAVLDGREDLDDEARELPAEFLDAIDDCINVFSVGDIPHECRPLFGLVERLQKEWQEYALYVGPANPLPRRAFWEVLGEMKGALAFCPPETTEMQVDSVKYLREVEGLDWVQIAMQYQWEGVGPFFLNGQPQPNLVRREYDKPGSVLPPDWVHPYNVKARAEAAKYENHLARRAERLRELNARFSVAEAIGAEPVAGPELIEDLFAAGVPDAQIEKIKLLSAAEVAAAKKRWAAEQKGLVAPASQATSSQAASRKSKQPASNIPFEEVRSVIADWLSQHPDATNADIAQAVGCEVRMVAMVRNELEA